ncbi:MAG: phage portal protein [Oscillospiraceae bacterium]|nr:phage portal protein [Oscillospiraceae bacterium]
MELFGRRTIYTSRELTRENVISEINEALSVHGLNLAEEDYLYWYRRGRQPVLEREKLIRPEICNKIVENHAEQITAFKNGYFLTQPLAYISRSEESAERVKQLNEYLYLSGKRSADNSVVDWFHTVGKGVLFVKANPDKKTRKRIPAKVYALDPRSAFVVYSLGAEKEPMYGVNCVVDRDRLKIDVFSKDYIFHLSGGYTGENVTPWPIRMGTAFSVDSVEENVLGLIPIIEYRYNSVNMGAFEAVIPLMDAMNTAMSNRVDGIEQFIQSLLVFYNCELGQDEDGNAITPRQVREAGALFLQNVGENKADLKEISSNLNQTETQVLVDYMYQQILTICGMPSTTKGGASTSDTGTAVLARDGWYQADTVARNTEDLFRESNKYFDEVFLEILRINADFEIDPSEFELQFVRNETANAQSKAQAAVTLLTAGMHPELAFAKSGISNDPVSDVAKSEAYLKLRWGDPNAPQTEEKIEKTDVIV